MSLQERFQNNRARQKISQSEINIQVSELKKSFEIFRQEKKKELDTLSSIASKTLAPYLDVVKKEYLIEGGKISIEKKGPYLVEGYIWATNEESRKHREHERLDPCVIVGLYKDLSEHTSFHLQLRLDRNHDVTIAGSAEYFTRDYFNYAVFNLEDEGFSQKIEGAIYSIIMDTNNCIRRSSEQRDTAWD